MNTKEILQGIKDWAAPKVIYDISAAHNNTKYTDLSNALGTNGDNIPQEYRKGGITVRYVQSYDNKYVQYFLTKDEWSVSESDWEKMNIEEDLGQLLYDAIPFDSVGKALLNNGVLSSASTYNVTRYLSVKKGQRFLIKGLTGSSASWATVCGYSEQSADSFVEIIVPGFDGNTRQVTFEIPDGVAYIRASACNDTDPRFKVAFLGILATDVVKESVDSVEELSNENAAAITDIYTEIDLTTYDEISLTDYSQGIFWTNTGTILAGLYVVRGIANLNLTVGIATQLSSSSVFRNPELVIDGKNIKFQVTEQDIENGAKYLRVRTTAGQTPLLCIATPGLKINDVVKQIQSQLPAQNLSGKKISIIGDSISTIYGKNNPYWVVKSIDVGQQIQSYVTWWDVWQNEAGTIPTNKTIGGVTLTDGMIGTLQTFTPVAGDVGKLIGMPLNYNSSGTKVWSERFCELTGAILLANASWSGARICSGQTGQWEISEAWNDFTIGCCKLRDDDGNDVVPDIIIVYRGTNDFSHAPISRIDDVSIDNGIPATDLINNVYEFKAGYYKTIQKLREAYPKAYIICCTLNVFKRGIYNVFPTRNNYYTLPEMNDVIRDIANTMGCGLVEFDKDGITFENCYPTYISDSGTTPTHPNNTGHEAMAMKALADITYCL